MAFLDKLMKLSKKLKECRTSRYFGVLYFTDEYMLRVTLNGRRWKSVVWEMDHYLRGRTKYEELTEEVDTALRQARDKLWEEMDNEGLSLDDDC